MASARFAWGIDIGNRALKAIKLVVGPGGLQVDDYEVVEHETVLSTAGDNRESLIQSALANFVQRHPGIEKGLCAVGVSGQQSFARFIKLPPVEPKKIPEIVRFEAIQQIPFPLDDVEWAYQLFQDDTSPDVEVGIFAMRKDLVNQHIKYFTDIDLNVQVVQMNPLAVYNAMYYDNRIKGTTMIVDLGAENTDLIIAEGETIWLRSIPIGGNNFTEALTKAFKGTSFPKAEDLKRNANTSKYGRQIMQAMRPIFADLVAEIQRSIGFYASVHRESRITKVIALGSTFRLPGLQKYLQQNLQLDVEKLEGLGGGLPEDPKLAAGLSENLLSMVGAYGLALQAMGQAKISSSLLPEKIRREKMWREKTKWFGAAAALFLVGAAIPYGSYYFNNWQYGQAMQNDQPDITRVISGAESNARNWTSIETEGAADRQRILNVKSLASFHDLWPRLIQDICATLPQFSPGAPAELKSTDPEKIKKIPRTDRKLIVIDSIQSSYTSDMTTALKGDLSKYVPSAPTDSGGSMDFNPSGPPVGFGPMGPGGGPPMFPGGGPPMPMGMPGDPGGGTGLPSGQGADRGFVITVHCTTPNGQGVGLVNDTFVKNLMAIAKGAAGNRPYYIAKVTISTSLKIRNDQARMQKMQQDFQLKRERERTAAAAAAAAAGNPAGGPPLGVPAPVFNVPGIGGTGAGGAAVDDPTPYLDPVLQEDTREDTESTVVFAVVLDPTNGTAKVASAAP